MKCPFCGQTEDRVVDSREARGGAAIRRRRECLNCSQRYTTYEAIDEVPQLVVKRDGTREPYDRRKLLAGLATACEKRPISAAQLEALVDQVEDQFGVGEEIPSEVIGGHVMRLLKELDQIAYVRFASVYRRFEDVEEFRSELEELNTDEPLTPVS